MGRLLIFSIIFMLVLSPVLANTDSQTVSGNLLPEESTKVAYLYRDFFRIDPLVVLFFHSHGIGVDYIRETTLPRDLSIYKFVFIGDENFKRTEFLDFENLRTVVVNYHNTEDFGLTDDDGASQMGSSRPLGVISGGEDIQVYTQAFYFARVAIPYYFLDQNNVIDGLESVATTRPSSSGSNFGDVILYGSPGVVLENGETLNQKTCYFGIAKSTFWTSGARGLFEDCVDFVEG